MPFENNSDSESEEEILIYADVKCVNFKDCKGPTFFKAIGIDTDTPYIQIDDHVFEGEHVESMGTNLFFEETSDIPETDPIFSEELKSSLKYICKTNKALNLNRIFLKSKIDNSTFEKTIEDKEFTVNEAATIETALSTFSDYYEKQKNNLPNPEFSESDNNKNTSESVVKSSDIPLEEEEFNI